MSENHVNFVEGPLSADSTDKYTYNTNEQIDIPFYSTGSSYDTGTKTLVAVNANFYNYV